MTQKTSIAQNAYSPLYFLSALGAGGLTVTFFMFAMFWVPHPGRPVPIFEDIAAHFLAGSVLTQVMIAVMALGIAAFAVLNIKTLLWNFSAMKRFRQSEAYRALRRSNGETTLLAAPLATAMTVNVLFIVGLVFVPSLWSIVEYMFPMAMVAFGALAIWALRLIGDFLGRVLSDGGLFDVTAHNSFAQLLPAFALAMIAVGMAAPAAMSHTALTVSISLILSTFLATAAVIYTVFAAITAFTSMLHHGTAKEAAPTLMVIVPIITVLSILVLRQNHGLHTTFEAHQTAIDTLMFLAKMISVQVVFILLGLAIMKRQGYAARFISGPEASAGSYALICPGVALSVLLHFFINKGLVAAGIIAKFGLAYWSLSAMAVMLQIGMIVLLITLNRKHMSTREIPLAPVAAE